MDEDQLRHVEKRKSLLELAGRIEFAPGYDYKVLRHDLSESGGWTPEEINEALQIVPMTGAEIVEAGLLGGWSEEGITDSEEWVEQQRSKRRDLKRS